MSIKRVVACRHLGATGKGGSSSEFIADKDGIQYVTKFKENPQGLRVLANELVVNGMAQFLKLPCPEGVIIEINKDFLDINPPLARLATTGDHFGIQRVGGVYPSPPASLLREVTNREVFPGVIVLDILTINHDRKLDNALIVRPDFNPTQFFFSIIDHGHCFGSPNWSIDITARVGTWPRKYIHEMVGLIEGSSPFETYLEKLESLTQETVSNIISAVPEEWQVSKEEREALLKFVVAQRDHVEQILNDNKHLFPLWR